jgi:hypothetical protein
VSDVNDCGFGAAREIEDMRNVFEEQLGRWNSARWELGDIVLDIYDEEDCRRHAGCATV